MLGGEGPCPASIELCRANCRDSNYRIRGLRYGLMRQTRFRRLAGLAVLGLALAACSSGSSAPTESGSSAPPSSGDAPVADCAPIELMSPQGERVDLTGTWEGGIFVHHVRQVGDCVWWIGYARWPGTELGELATLTFLGRLAPDFSLSGQWATIMGPVGAGPYYPGPPDGRVAFLVEFDPESGTANTLTRIGAGTTDREYPTDELRRVGQLPASADPGQQ